MPMRVDGAPWTSLVAPAAAYAEVYIVGAQSIPASAFTKINHDTVVRQSSGNPFDTTNHQFVCPVTGLYIVGTATGFSPAITPAATAALAVFLNGSEAKRGPQVPTTFSSLAMATPIWCSASDVLDIRVFKDKAGSDPLAVNNAAITWASFELATAGRYFDAVVSKTTTYTLTATDDVVLADATTAAFTVTLPTATGIAGRRYTVKKIDATLNFVTIATTSSQTIDGLTTRVLTMKDDTTIVESDGTNWRDIDQNLGNHRAARQFSRQTWR